ncbi:MAG: serine/threonine-protein kinase [Kiloniellaceae bacterium]
MVSDLIGEEVFRDLTTAALQDVTGVLLPGSHLAMALATHVSKAFFKVLSKHRKADQQDKLDALARMPFSRAYDMAARQVAEADLDDAQKAALIKYLSAVPMTSRQAIHRWNDGGHVTTLLSQLPRSPEEMARFVPIRPPRFRPGDKIPGHDLRLESLLGQGGFAEVWKAHHTERAAAPPVALKFCLDMELLPSLKQEIELLDRLQDQSPEKDFVQLLQTAYSADPPFLIYEYIDGGNLTSWLESFGGKAPKPKEVVAVLKMAARALTVAHDNKIVHRDLKPANLLVTSQGRVKVADFGIGRFMAASEAAEGGREIEASINPTLIHGAFTPIYCDPARDRLAAPSPQDDVYALGVVAYQLLVGNVTWRMDGGWRRRLEDRGVPAPLIEVIDTCVAPANHRYGDAGALLAALETPPRAAKPKAEKPRPKPRAAQREAEPAAETALRYCHQCGGRVAAGNRFCNACGYRLP